MDSGFISFLSEKTVSIPLSQLVLFIVLNSLCLLLGKHKLGLLISYCFVLYWGFYLNMEYFTDYLGGTSLSLPVFLISGLTVLILIIIGIFRE